MVHYAFVQKRKSNGKRLGGAGNVPQQPVTQYRQKVTPGACKVSTLHLKPPQGGGGDFFVCKGALCGKILHIFCKFCAIYINFSARLDF